MFKKFLTFFVRNPGLPSIEGEVIRALLEAELITQDHHDMPRKVGII